MPSPVQTVGLAPRRDRAGPWKGEGREREMGSGWCRCEALAMEMRGRREREGDGERNRKRVRGGQGNFAMGGTKACERRPSRNLHKAGRYAEQRGQQITQQNTTLGRL